MQIVLTKSDVDALAKRIVEYLWEEIPTGAIPEKPKKAEEVVAEPVKELTAKKEVSEPVKEEAAEQEGATYTLEQVIKAVKEYTLKDKDGAKKLKPILQSLGVERLSLLPNDVLPEFIVGARKVGVEI